MESALLIESPFDSDEPVAAYLYADNDVKIIGKPGTIGEIRARREQERVSMLKADDAWEKIMDVGTYGRCKRSLVTGAEASSRFRSLAETWG